CLGLFLFVADCDRTLSGSGGSYPAEMPPFEKFQVSERPYLDEGCGAIIVPKSFVIRHQGYSEIWDAYFKEGAAYPFLVEQRKAGMRVESVYWVDPGQDGRPDYYFPDDAHYYQKFPNVCSILGKKSIFAPN